MYTVEETVEAFMDLGSWGLYPIVTEATGLAITGHEPEVSVATFLKAQRRICPRPAEAI